MNSKMSQRTKSGEYGGQSMLYVPFLELDSIAIEAIV